MKKILAIVLSIVMVLSVGFSSVIVASATTIASQETTKKKVKPSVTVNGSTTSDIAVQLDDNDPNKIIFTYSGDGNLTGWNFYDGNGNLLTEGVDYEVVYDENMATVTVLVLVDEIVADAIVEGEEEKPTNTKPNKDNESPNTGAMGLTGLAVAGAGVAVLAAMKRKSDAE